MGCDIHCYVERQNGSGRWVSVGGRLNPGRDYDLFAKIADVRNYGGQVNGVMQPKGLPKDLGWEAQDDDRLRVVPDDAEPGDNEVKRRRAADWVEGGSSCWIALGDKQEYFVSDPDHHSHTWLTATELRAVLERPRPNGWGISPNYFGVLGMMEAIEGRGSPTRLVIWFDN